LFTNSYGLGMTGSIGALLLSLVAIWVAVRPVLGAVNPQYRRFMIGLLGIMAACLGLLHLSRAGIYSLVWTMAPNWERISILGVILGGVGQILIAMLALYVAWKEYLTTQRLTSQQNTITRQQTIDAYCQGIAQLMLDSDGQLRDSPMERAIATGRTAAILTSVDPPSKAKVLQFLHRSKLLTPLKRENRVGRAILDGYGSYAEDRDYGIRVIDLDVMLTSANLSAIDVSSIDLSEINMIHANLSYSNLEQTNLSRTILCDASLRGANLRDTCLYYGPVTSASPRTRRDIPDYTTGAYTGAVIEGVDLKAVRNLSEEQRYYCCAWGGSKTRKTVPGGCQGIPNLLGR
ncbi:MAG TPA: pentapeptide repeat-containing protein, partial [Allocoleopsis sp.]